MSYLNYLEIYCLIGSALLWPLGIVKDARAQRGPCGGKAGAALVLALCILAAALWPAVLWFRIKR